MAKDLKTFASHEYLERAEEYRMVRDCYKGSSAIKKAAERYLPRLSEQKDHDYNNYLIRALFFPITGKSASTMVGMATVKAPETSYPEAMKPYFIDSEQSYQFTEFYTSVFTEIVLMGRHGVLIDAPVGVAGAMPTIVPYHAENIVRWELDDVGKCVSLLLREHRTVKGTDRFEASQVTQFRHCFIDPATGMYNVETLDEDLVVTTAAVTPFFTGSTIDFIPFVPFGSSGVHYNVDKPPMIDIASINVSHYMSSADLEWGRHITGLPTPVISGVDASTKLYIGGTAAWILPDVQAKAYYMEFLGQGLQSLEKALAEKISLMASVSARMVDSSSRGSEAAETVRLRYMSESASLIHIIGSIENGMNMLYTMLGKLLKLSQQPQVKFSREILGQTITFKDLAILFEAFLNETISKETLVYNLRRLDAINPNRSDEDEMQAIRDAVRPTNTPANADPKPTVE